AYFIDTHPRVHSFVKNAGLGFAIPYLHNGEKHDYLPDFLIRLKVETPAHLILETKGFDPLWEVKQSAALRWTTAVNADDRYGFWKYALVSQLPKVSDCIEQAYNEISGLPNANGL